MTNSKSLLLSLLFSLCISFFTISGVGHYLEVWDLKKLFVEEKKPKVTNDLKKEPNKEQASQE